MRGVRDDDGPARVAAVLVIGADEHEAGQLPMRAGRRLERGGVQAGQLGQPALQLAEHRERPLRGLVGGPGVEVPEARQTGDDLGLARVVLHRARPEGVEADVDAVVAVRQTREVPDDVQLAQLRQQGHLVGQLHPGQHAGGVDDGHIEVGEPRGATALDRALEQRGLRGAEITEDGHLRPAFRPRRRRARRPGDRRPARRR